ncbi:hypothetical protein [Streptomyces sp. NBC_00687]|uniref:hypothetical protein n=1 Tax=Streptomyces sp. NBC_00687 TaxID=2975807 RepID=UPI00225378D4|nr:hypothetical protein [Streptomyces sp. NBC_00687]MCX4912887.1 hypothetical protein [Streptomyces sp. NBC_00687]
MTNSLLRGLDMIGPLDLVIYHGSIPSEHGLWVAVPCPCSICERMDRLGIADVRFALIDPWTEEIGPVHVRRKSLTRSKATD